jgi:hypothetical protein
MDQISELTKALIAFHKKVGPVLKGTSGQFGRYADLHQVLETVNPVLLEHDLVVTQTFTIDGDLCTTLHHVSGGSISSTVKLLPNNSKNPLHGWGGGVTYMRRYALLGILNLSAGLEDDDGGSAGVAKPAPSTDDDFL